MTAQDTPNETTADGLKTGLWTEPDSHGGVMVGSYVEGQRHGTWQHFSSDGRLRSEGGYENDELHAEWTWFRANGKLLQKGGFDRGQKHGLWERWKPDGEFLDSTTWDHGRKKKTP